MSELDLGEFIAAELASMTNPAEAVEPEVQDVEEESTETVDTETAEEGEPNASEDEESPQSDGEVYTVKVDGENVEVSLDELKAGYSRTAHFHRQQNALKEERLAFEAEVEQVAGQFQQIQDLDQAWQANPVTVLTNLIGTVDNPAYALGLLIKEMAATSMLPPEALEYFGIDQGTQSQWANETELERTRAQLAAREQQEQAQRGEYDEYAKEQRINNKVQEYLTQIDQVIAEDDLQLTPDEAQDLKSRVIRYARENDIFDMRKAYGALAWEEAKANKAREAKRAATAAKKAANNVITKSSSSGDAVHNIHGDQGMTDSIREAARELGMF